MTGKEIGQQMRSMGYSLKFEGSQYSVCTPDGKRYVMPFSRKDWTWHRAIVKFKREQLTTNKKGSTNVEV